jgi:hypothetical protein
MNKTSVLLLASFLTFSSHVSAEWAYLTEGTRAKYYIDYDRVSKNNGYTYFWHLHNMLEPHRNMMSMMIYGKVECASPKRFMNLQLRGYDQHFGEGNNISTQSPPKEWTYPKPESLLEIIINEVCRH